MDLRLDKKLSRWPALALAAASVCLPAVAAEPVATAAGEGPDAHVVVRDATTGRLRAATSEEAQEHAARAASERAARARSGTSHASAGALVRHHANGAKSVRMTDEMVSQVVAVRRGTGAAEAFCMPDKASAQATVAFTAPSARSAAKE